MSAAPDFSPNAKNNVKYSCNYCRRQCKLMNQVILKSLALLFSFILKISLQMRAKYKPSLSVNSIRFLLGTSTAAIIPYKCLSACSGNIYLKLWSSLIISTTSSRRSLLFISRQNAYVRSTYSSNFLALSQYSSISAKVICPNCLPSFLDSSSKYVNRRMNFLFVFSNASSGLISINRA